MEKHILERIEYNETRIESLKQDNIELRERLDKNVKGIEKWVGYEFESSSGTTQEFLDFCKDFKKHIKQNLPDGAELVFNRGHFYVYGFVKRLDKYVYFSISDVRHFRDGWYNDILIRTAEGEKDFTGGSNSQTSLDKFKERVEYLLR